MLLLLQHHARVQSGPPLNADPLAVQLLMKFGADGKRFSADVEVAKDHRAASGLEALFQGIIKKLMYPDRITRKVVPAFCHVACGLAIWEHQTSRQLRYTWLPLATLFFELSVPVILTLAQYIMRMDPGIQRDGDLGQIMLLLERGEFDSLPDLKRLCTTTWIFKKPRAKYCSLTGSCIEEFDHFCILLDTPIGKGNHRTFLVLLILELLAQLAHVALCFSTFHRTDWRVIFLLLIHLCTVPGMSLLVLGQAILISKSLTMNEVLNMHRYQHFRSEGRFRNPFSKGSIAQNCLDFWCFRRRASMEKAEYQPDPTCDLFDTRSQKVKGIESTSRAAQVDRPRCLSLWTMAPRVQTS